MKKICFSKFYGFPLKATLIFSLVLIIFASDVCAQNNDIFVPASQVKMIKKFSLKPSATQTPTVVAPNALYSNVTTFSGFARLNGGAALQGSNTITALVADSLGFVSTPFYSIGSFVFSVANFDAGDVTARPRVRFYLADGVGNGPGTLIAGYSFAANTFSGGSISLFDTGPLSHVAVNATAMWAGITFDNENGTTGATAAQLNNLGQAIFGPPDAGTSTDNIFSTDAAGDFLSDDPIGSTLNFGGAPVADFGLEIVSSSPLPITLAQFEVKRSGTGNNLTWSTSQELNSKYFVVERSADGNNFKQIGQVNAAGNTNTKHDYLFTDLNPLKGINYYRLRVVDIDNATRFSEIRSVKNIGQINFTIYPNPIKVKINLDINTEKRGKAQIGITNINGQAIYKREVNLEEGSNSFSINVNNFAKGTYVIKIQLSDASFVKKFNKE